MPEPEPACLKCDSRNLIDLSDEGAEGHEWECQGCKFRWYEPESKSTGQGSGEEATFSQEEFAAMLELGKRGVAALIAAQRTVIDESGKQESRN